MYKQEILSLYANRKISIGFESILHCLNCEAAGSDVSFFALVLLSSEGLRVAPLELNRVLSAQSTVMSALPGLGKSLEFV